MRNAFKFFALFSFFLFISCKTVSDNSIENNIKKNDSKKSEEICSNIFDNEFCSLTLNQQYTHNQILKKEELLTGRAFADVDTIESGILQERSTVFVAVKNSISDKSSVRMCTGVVISDHFILTAAHCFYEEKTSDDGKIFSDFLLPESRKKNGKGFVKIGIGETIYDSSMKYIDVESVIISPMYDSSSLGLPFGDIALVKTYKSLKKLSLKPTKVTTSSIVGEKVWSVGYGLINRTNVNSFGVKRWLMSISSIPHVSFCYYSCTESDQLMKDALKYHDSSIKGYIDISQTTRMQNSFLIIKKKGVFYGQICDGDSGGPQFVTRDSQTALVGISEGFSHYLLSPKTFEFSAVKKDFCKSRAAVSTRIAPYLIWINKQMKPYKEKLEDIDIN